MERKLPALGSTRQISITPTQIDAGNINTLEEQAFVDHIIFFKPDCVYIDAPCHPAGIPALVKRFDMLLAPHLAGRLPKYIIEPKADLKYPIVGAASIIAKVIRDAQLKIIEGDVGSGYPSDPRTRKLAQRFWNATNHSQIVSVLAGEPSTIYVNKYSFRNNIPVFI